MNVLIQTGVNDGGGGVGGARGSFKWRKILDTSAQDVFGKTLIVNDEEYGRDGGIDERNTETVFPFDILLGIRIVVVVCENI